MDGVPACKGHCSYIAFTSVERSGFKIPTRTVIPIRYKTLKLFYNNVYTSVSLYKAGPDLMFCLMCICPSQPIVQLITHRHIHIYSVNCSKDNFFQIRYLALLINKGVHLLVFKASSSIPIYGRSQICHSIQNIFFFFFFFNSLTKSISIYTRWLFHDLVKNGKPSSVPSFNVSIIT